MKPNPKAQAEHLAKLQEAVEALCAYGLKKYEFPTAVSMGRETPFDACHVIMPAPSVPHYGALSIDLTAVAVDKMLVAMFDHAYRKGFEDGEREAEDRQASAIIEAFPSLKTIIAEIADETAQKRVDDLRRDLNDP